MRRGRGAPRGPLVALRDRVHVTSPRCFHIPALRSNGPIGSWHWSRGADLQCRFTTLLTNNRPALVSTGAHTRFGKIKTHAAQAKQIKFGRAPSVDNGIILFSIFASPRSPGSNDSKLLTDLMGLPTANWAGKESKKTGMLHHGSIYPRSMEGPNSFD
jgi:hypothetical protein